MQNMEAEINIKYKQGREMKGAGKRVWKAGYGMRNEGKKGKERNGKKREGLK